MDHASYSLTLPQEQTSCVVFASPHSGRHYPPGFLRDSVLNELVIRSSEDAFMDILIEQGSKSGSPVLCATLPRAYLDLNRATEELDPSLIEGVRLKTHNPRVASGLGVIPRVVSNGRAIYRGKLPQKEAKRRIEGYWQPYDDRLQTLLDETHARYGEAILVDWHSMPHEAVQAVNAQISVRPDVVIGDRFGASADEDIVARVETILLEAGLRVTRNAPFAGAYIVQHYGRPSRKQHALQIEVDRALYMDEAQVVPNENFSEFQSLMNRVVAEISQVGCKSMMIRSACGARE